MTRQYSRREIVQAYVWLAIFAAASATMQFAAARPAAVALAAAFALLFNAVLTKTACLWTSNSLVPLIPLGVWCAVWALLGASWIVPAGIAGGVWPLLNRK
ncbi:hypothetical protein V6D40_10070 [Corynebacterium sp. Q4381]|uniref:hypothetical protein n=1 Tax=Corynebacterium sp. Marseille-Q4381 TaxID=3121597 RepID=UPI002FE59224